MQYHQKTIVLTGGTSGVGHEMVRILSQENKVIVVARQGPRLQHLETAFSNVTTIAADLSDADAYPRLAEEILTRFPQIDMLVNNAAVQHTPTVLDPSFCYDSIAAEIQVNFSAVCALTVLLLPGLQKSGDASLIVNINSGLALAPKTSSAVYCATKAAMNAFSKSLAYQLEATPLRVKQVFLPLVDTPMTSGRGSGKISAEHAASQIVAGLNKPGDALYVGKTKLLRALLVVAPGIAAGIMKRA